MNDMLVDPSAYKTVTNIDFLEVYQIGKYRLMILVNLMLEDHEVVGFVPLHEISIN